MSWYYWLDEWTIYRRTDLHIGMRSVAGWIESASLGRGWPGGCSKYGDRNVQMIDSFWTQFRNGSMCVFRQICMSRSGVTGSGNINGIDPELLDELLGDPNIKYGCDAGMHVKPQRVTILAGVDMKHWGEEHARFG